MTLDSSVRVGVVVADPLRRLGLTTILRAIGLDAVELELQAVAVHKDLAALLMDVHSCGGALAEVIKRLRVERDGLKIVVVGDSLEPEFIQAMI
ncbi:MAG: hypothetical protein ABI142_02810, partial [Bryocella sp.]